MSKERYAEHTVAWELPNGDSVTKSNYNLADIETKYIPIQTEIISDNKDKNIVELQQRISELEEQLKNARKETIDNLAISLVTCFSSDAEFTREEIVDWLQKVKDQIQGEKENV